MTSRSINCVQSHGVNWFLVRLTLSYFDDLRYPIPIGPVFVDLISLRLFFSVCLSDLTDN